MVSMPGRVCRVFLSIAVIVLMMAVLLVLLCVRLPTLKQVPVTKHGAQLVEAEHKEDKTETDGKDCR
jgi:hypothetical protein